MPESAPYTPSGETIFAKIRKRSHLAFNSNPHLNDITTGSPTLLASGKAPTIDTSQTWTTSSNIIAAGYSQPFLAAQSSVINPKFTYTGGWPIVYASSYVRLPCVTSYSSGVGNAASNPPLSAYSSKVHFITDSPKFVIGSAGACQARFIVEGQYVSLGLTSWPATSMSAVVLDFTAVGGRSRRNITIEFNGPFNFAGLWFGPTDTYEPTVFAEPIRAAYFGDSISTGSNATVSGDCFAEVCSDHLGITDTRRPSIGTTGYGVGSASLYTAEQHVFDIINQKPDFIFLTHNVNSFNNFAGGWNDVKYYWQSVYGQIRSWNSTVPIVQWGVLNSATVGETNYANANSYEIAQKSYITNLSNSDPNLFYVPIITDPLSPWITGRGYTGTLTGDGNRENLYGQAGPHPNTNGHYYVGMRLARGTLAAISGKA